MSEMDRAVLRVDSYGEDAFLIHPVDPATIPALLDALDGQISGTSVLREAHPGERSILVRFDPTSTASAASPASTASAVGTASEPSTIKPATTPHAEIEGLLANLLPIPSPSAQESVTLPVRYDGPDLTHVADQCNLSVDAVVALHQRTTYRAAFCGFAPGFAYLTGLPQQLQLPRLDSPRSVVPAGSVAIAAHYCAVYPSQSPGGWLLIGHCDTELFDPSATPPALLVPGTAVRFEAI